MLKKIVFIFINFLLLSFPSFSYTKEDYEIQALQQQIVNIQKKIKTLEQQKINKFKITKKRPKIGLVLSGGGAKGFAHIGVLKVLEKNNIKVDYITGSSMGALIGSLYSAGYSPDQIEKLMLDINWQDAFNDRPNEEDIPLDQRAIVKNYNLSLKYDNSFNFDLPKSLRNTQRIYLTLKNLLWNVEKIHNFEKLPIPLEIIATDLNTGKAKAFKSGDLARVVTASISIPTVFDPIKINNSYYVDGLLSRNFPVQDAFKLGADIVIGVDVGTSVRKRKNYNILSVADQIIAIQSASSTEKQKDMATILISPDVKKFKTTDFDNYKEIEEMGEIAAEKEIKNILSFHPELAIEKTKEIHKKNFVLKNLLIYNHSKNKNHREIIKSIFSSYENKSISPNQLEELILKIYSLNFVNKVYYTFDNNTLNLEVEENPTNLLGLGFNYETDYGSTFSIGSDISSSGKFGNLATIEARFGDYLGFDLQNFFYYGLSNKIGILTSLSYDETPFYLYSNKSKIGDYKASDLKLETAFLTQYSNIFLFSYGASLNYAELESEVKNPLLDSSIEYSKSYGDLFFRIDWDRTNSSNFPSKGYKGTILQRWGGDLGEDDLNFLSSNYMASGYIPFTNNLTLITKIFGGNVSGEDVLPDKYIKLGGIKDNLSENEFSFNGYYLQEKYLSSLFGGRIAFQYKLIDNLYLNTSWDLATYKYVNENVNQENSVELWQDYHQGFGIGLNYSSLIGPLEFSISKTHESSDLLFQFKFGFDFDY